MIITNVNEIGRNRTLVMTSIGGAPIHEGHTQVITGCKSRAILEETCFKTLPIRYFDRSDFYLLVIVNSDEFLMRKHGYVFQNEKSRAKILDAIKDVDYVYIHHSEKQTVDEAIRIFKPKYFCKGGDRSGPEFMPAIELQAADDIGCRVLYGVGGTEKVTSSTTLIDNIVNVINDRNKGRDDLGQTT